MQAMIQGEVSFCSLDARNSSSLQNRHSSRLTSQRSGSSHSPGSGIRLWHRQIYPSHRHSGFGITLCVPSQLAQSSSCPSNQIYFTSKNQGLHCNGQCLASVTLSRCFWETVHCCAKPELGREVWLLNSSSQPKGPSFCLDSMLGTKLNS